MNWTRARELVDESLARSGQPPATGGEWELLASDPELRARNEYGTTPEEDWATEAAVALRFSRRRLQHRPSKTRRQPTGQRYDPLSPPEWWEAESQRRLALYREERILMRVDAGICTVPEPGPEERRTWHAMFGLPSPDAEAGVGPYVGLGSAAEVKPLLEKLRGDHYDAYLPKLEEPPWGWDADDFMDYEDAIEVPAETWERDRQVDRIWYVPAAMMAVRSAGPSLDRLHFRSRSIAADLGISQAECLVWGLTDLPFTIPWMPVLIDRREEWSYGDWTSATIQVNSMSATAHAVSKAFRVARDGSQDGVRRAPRPWPALVFAFVQQHLDESWDERFATFRRVHPDQQYKGMASFRAAYYQQRQKKGGE